MENLIFNLRYLWFYILLLSKLYINEGFILRKGFLYSNYSKTILKKSILYNINFTDIIKIDLPDKSILEPPKILHQDFNSPMDPPLLPNVPKLKGPKPSPLFCPPINTQDIFTTIGTLLGMPAPTIRLNVAAERKLSPFLLPDDWYTRKMIGVKILNLAFFEYMRITFKRSIPNEIVCRIRDFCLSRNILAKLRFIYNPFVCAWEQEQLLKGNCISVDQIKPPIEEEYFSNIPDSKMNYQTNNHTIDKTNCKFPYTLQQLNEFINKSNSKISYYYNFCLDRRYYSSQGWILPQYKLFLERYWSSRAVAYLGIYPNDRLQFVVNAIRATGYTTPHDMMVEIYKGPRPCKSRKGEKFINKYFKLFEQREKGEIVTNSGISWRIESIKKKNAMAVNMYTTEIELMKKLFEASEDQTSSDKFLQFDRFRILKTFLDDVSLEGPNEATEESNVTNTPIPNVKRLKKSDPLPVLKGDSDMARNSFFGRFIHTGIITNDTYSSHEESISEQQTEPNHQETTSCLPPKCLWWMKKGVLFACSIVQLTNMCRDDNNNPLMSIGSLAAAALSGAAGSHVPQPSVIEPGKKINAFETRREKRERKRREKGQVPDRGILIDDIINDSVKNQLYEYVFGKAVYLDPEFSRWITENHVGEEQWGIDPRHCKTPDEKHRQLYYGQAGEKLLVSNRVNVLNQYAVNNSEAIPTILEKMYTTAGFVKVYHLAAAILRLCHQERSPRVSPQVRISLQLKDFAGTHYGASLQDLFKNYCDT